MADVVTFDPVNLRIIEISTGGDNELDWREIYSEWKDWLLAVPQRRGLPQAFRVVGGDPTSDTENLGSTFFMLHPWKFRPAESDHNLQINGNLFPDPPDWQTYAPTLGGFTVLFELKVSTLVEQVNTGGGGGGCTAEDCALIIEVLQRIDANVIALGAGAVDGIDCGITPVVLPTIYVGHKGDSYAFPVYRNEVLISPSELATATGLQVTWENEDTAQTVIVTVGVAADESTVAYTVTDADLVFETVGKWVGQASGIAANGEPFKSQQIRQLVEPPVT